MNDVNIWAVLACGAASMILGSIWYGPLFGKRFGEEMGFGRLDPAVRERMTKDMGKSYMFTLVGALLTAYVLAVTLVNFETDSVGMALQGAFWIWLGFILPVAWGAKLWDSKSWTLVAINAGQYLVQLAAFATILTLWK